jgi:hypothetical protein
LGMLCSSCTWLQVTSNMHGRGSAMMRSRYQISSPSLTNSHQTRVAGDHQQALGPAQNHIRTQRLLQKPDTELHVSLHSFNRAVANARQQNNSALAPLKETTQQSQSRDCTRMSLPLQPWRTNACDGMLRCCTTCVMWHACILARSC